MATWVEDITQALINLGGLAPYSEIYAEVKRIRTVPLPEHWEASIRATIEDHSSDSTRFKYRKDIFYSVDGLGGGVWGLRNYNTGTPEASDLTSPSQKVETTTYRILRDTKLARTIKALHHNRCQICGTRIELPNGNGYSEAHHIQPLGSPHNGPDVAGNILVLCPNHHVMCDYGVIELNIAKIRTHQNHSLNSKYITYHNTRIFKSKNG